MNDTVHQNTYQSTYEPSLDVVVLQLQTEKETAWRGDCRCATPSAPAAGPVGHLLEVRQSRTKGVLGPRTIPRITSNHVICIEGGTPLVLEVPDLFFSTC